MGDRKKGYVDEYGNAWIMDERLAAEFATVMHVLSDLTKHHRSYRNRNDMYGAALDSIKNIKLALVEGEIA